MAARIVVILMLLQLGAALPIQLVAFADGHRAAGGFAILSAALIDFWVAELRKLGAR